MNIYARAKALRESVGAPWFTAPWDLNLIVIRSGRVGRWDDRIVVATVDDTGREIVLVCQATGDAWEGEWTNPTHPDGCIYVLDQHVPGGYALGEHKGRPALRQQRPFHCVRWPRTRGTVPTVEELEELAEFGHDFTENRGTHIHNRVSDRAPEAPATNDSEGCTVTLYQHQHAALIELVKVQKRVRGSDVVSPTFCKRSTWKALG